MHAKLMPKLSYTGVWSFVQVIRDRDDSYGIVEFASKADCEDMIRKFDDTEFKPRDESSYIRIDLVPEGDSGRRDDRNGDDRGRGRDDRGRDDRGRDRDDDRRGDYGRDEYRDRSRERERE